MDASWKVIPELQAS